MTDAIGNILKENGLLICPSCRGEGEIGYFCGHETTTMCYMCAGNGVIRSTKKQKHRKPCSICAGRGGRGCCDNKGFHEWESYELFDASLKKS
jgi:hypothetical protein